MKTIRKSTLQTLIHPAGYTPRFYLLRDFLKSIRGLKFKLASHQRGLVMKAICLSEECNGLTSTGKKIGRIEKDVKPFVNTCPDCGSVLVWQKSKGSKMQTAESGKTKERAERSAG